MRPPDRERTGPLQGPARHEIAPQGDAHTVARSGDVEQLWTLLSDCPADAVRWAGIGWALGHAERDLDLAHDLEVAGREALAIIRPFWRSRDDAARARATADKAARARA